MTVTTAGPKANEGAYLTNEELREPSLRKLPPRNPYTKGHNKQNTSSGTCAQDKENNNLEDASP